MTPHDTDVLILGAGAAGLVTALNARGRRVTVCSSGRCVKVKLIDFCACPSRVIDLYRDAFARLASPSRGVIRVTVSSGGGPSSTLPPTSTSEGEGS